MKKEAIEKMKKEELPTIKERKKPKMTAKEIKERLESIRRKYKE